MDFAVYAERDKEGSFAPDSALFAGYDGIAHAVAAGVIIKIRLYRRPRGAPDIPSVVYIIVSSTHVNRDVVVAVAGYPSEACIPVEGISARSVGDKREVVFASQIVYPGVGGLGVGDDVFKVFIVEISEFHSYMFLSDMIPKITLSNFFMISWQKMFTQ